MNKQDKVRVCWVNKKTGKGGSLEAMRRDEAERFISSLQVQYGNDYEHWIEEIDDRGARGAIDE